MPTSSSRDGCRMRHRTPVTCSRVNPRLHPHHQHRGFGRAGLAGQRVLGVLLQAGGRLSAPVPPPRLCPFYLHRDLVIPNLTKTTCLLPSDPLITRRHRPCALQSSSFFFPLARSHRPSSLPLFSLCLGQDFRVPPPSEPHRLTTPQRQKLAVADFQRSIVA